MVNVFQGLINAYAPSQSSGRAITHVHRSRSGYSPRAGCLCHKVLMVFQRQAKPMSIKAVAALLSADQGSIQRAVIRLHAQGVLESCGRENLPTEVEVQCVSYQANPDADLSRCRLGGAMVKVHEFLLEKGGHTLQDIVRTLGMDNSHVTSLLQRGLGTVFFNSQKVAVTFIKDVSVCLYQLKG